MTTSDPRPADETGTTGTSDPADGPGTGGATAVRAGAGARVLRSRWWRAGVAALALAGLVWGASAVDGGLAGGTGPGAAEDAATTTAGPSEVALVGSTALACPGTGTEGVPVEVVAARAPRSVLTGEAEPGASGVGADDAAVTTEPGPTADDAESTTEPGRSADDAESTTAVGPSADDAVATTSPLPAPGGDVDREGDLGDDGAQLVLSGDGAAHWELPAQEPRAVELSGTSSAFVLGHGHAAPGLVGAQLGVGIGPGERGAALAPCVRPAEELWLVGGDGRAGGTEQLVLSNPGTDPVTVRVRVWGTEGEVSTTGASGLVVPAGGRAEHLLDALAPGAESPVVSVTATGGPVAAHLDLLVRDGTTDLGAGTVSPAGSLPATDLVVPALPPSPEGSEHRAALRVLAPGEEEAVVDLTALTEEGAVRLPDLVTRAPAGRAVEIDLADLPAGTTGLRVRADAPVVAAANLEIAPAEGEPQEAVGDDAAEATDPPPDGAASTDAASTSAPGGDDAGTTEDPRDRPRDEPLVRPAGEVAWVSATVPSATPVGTALPDPAVVPAAASRLVVSAVDATTATVHWLDEDGSVTTEVVELANDTGRGLAVPTGARAVWVTTTDPGGEGPGAGAVAAVHVAGADGRGPLVASATLPSVPWTAAVTTVRPAVP